MHIAVITGVSGDLGGPTAHALLNRGVRVVGIDCRECADHGLRDEAGFEFHCLDLLTTRGSIPTLRKLFEELAARRPTQISLVNNASLTGFETRDKSVQTDLNVLEVNLISHFVLATLVCEVFDTTIKRIIVNISSRMAERICTGGSAYAISKCALEKMTREIAVAYAGDTDFVCMAVRPPPMEGRLQDTLIQQDPKVFPHARRARREREKGLASPRDVALWIVENCILREDRIRSGVILTIRPGQLRAH